MTDYLYGGQPRYQAGSSGYDPGVMATVPYPGGAAAAGGFTDPTGGLGLQYGIGSPSIVSNEATAAAAQAAQGLNLAKYGYGQQSLQQQYQLALARLGLQQRGLSADTSLAGQLYGVQTRGFDISGQDIPYQQGFAGQERRLAGLGTAAQQQYLGAGDQYYGQMHGLAGQLFGLQRGDIGRTYQTQVRDTSGDAAARGAYAGTGTQLKLGDLGSQYQSALGQLGVQQGQEQAGYEHQLAGQALQRSQVDVADQQSSLKYLGQQHDLDMAGQRLGLSREQAADEYAHSQAQFGILSDRLGIDRTELDQQLDRGLNELGFTTADQLLQGRIQLGAIAESNPQLIMDIINKGIAAIGGPGLGSNG